MSVEAPAFIEAERDLEPAGIDILLERHRARLEKFGKPQVDPIDFDLQSDEVVRRISAEFADTLTAPGNKALVAAEITRYNPGRIIEDEQGKVLPVRVESRNSELDSKVMFFREQNDVMRLDINLPIIGAKDRGYQDPRHMASIQGYKIIAPVEVKRHEQNPEWTMYRQVYFRYKNSISEIAEPFAYGSWGEKGTTAVEVDKKIKRFSRPQTNEIYVETMDDMEQIGAPITQAKKIEGLFGPKEWGGFNDLRLLDNGLIGIAGHIARYRPSNTNLRDYYATAGLYDPEQDKMIAWEIIFSAEQVPFPVTPKFPTLGHTFYPGGIYQREPNTYELNGGVGDSATAKVTYKMNPWEMIVN